MCVHEDFSLQRLLENSAAEFSARVAATQRTTSSGRRKKVRGPVKNPVVS